MTIDNFKSKYEQTKHNLMDVIDLTVYTDLGIQNYTFCPSTHIMLCAGEKVMFMRKGTNIPYVIRFNDIKDIRFIHYNYEERVTYLCPTCKNRDICKYYSPKNNAHKNKCDYYTKENTIND